jgi:MFS family permease
MASDPSRGAVASTAFAVVGYRALWLTGWVWHVARWMAVFASSYRVNELTGDPLLVQLVGAAFTAPMFVGGLTAGTFADRLDGRRIVAVALAVLAPLSMVMALAASGGLWPVGSTYLFVFLIGIGNVLDMTTRRSLAFELVGVGLVTNAAAMETFALHAGSMTGSLLGGGLIAGLGVDGVYLGIGATYLLALTAFLRALRAAGQRMVQPARTQVVSISQDLRESLGLLRGNEMLRRFLVFTVLMNFFYYAFVPLVPVFAERLDVGPFLTGLLASAIGAGTMTGSLVVAWAQPARRGALHIGGVLGAMTFLVVFSQMHWYPAALATLFVAGFCGSGFGTTQSALVVSMVPDELRGRALGALSMAIGALPFGNFTLGVIARQTDPRWAVTVSVGVGMIIVVAWQQRHPQLRRL